MRISLRKKILCRYLVGLALIVGVSAKPAAAYIDPMSGSFILQILLAAVFGALFAIKNFYSNIRSWLRRLLGKPADADEKRKDGEDSE